MALNSLPRLATRCALVGMAVVAGAGLFSIMARGAPADSPQAGAGAPARITADALWQPGMGFIQQVHRNCDNKPGDFGACFVAQIQKYGAPAAAIDFTRRTGNMGILRDFRPAGPVDIAYAVYLFRANENQVWFLVNGNPPMIDVDDIHYFPQAALEKNPAYQQIKQQFPNVAVFPGDRAGTKNPLVMHSPDGVLHIVVGYRLNDQCHACARVGIAYVEFNFDTAGKFLGTRLTHVIPDAVAPGVSGAPSAHAAPSRTSSVPPAATARPSASPSMSATALPPAPKPAPAPPKSPAPAARPPSANSGAPSAAPLPVLKFSDPVVPVQVKSGQQFTITLDSNRTTGYSWRLASNTDKAVVGLHSTRYIAPAATMPGAGGKEVWTFEATGKGTAQIHLEYVRPWETPAVAARQETFTVVVN